MTKESIKSFYNNLFGSLEVLDVNGVHIFRLPRLLVFWDIGTQEKL